MRTTTSVALLLVLTGCPEYTFPQGPQGWTGEPNPRELDDPVQVDRIVQVIEPVVDVLWVVDNSTSMRDEREALAANFPTFMQWFEDSGVDYHIGVTTTDMEDPQFSGRLRDVADTRFITPDTPDAVQRFTEMTTGMDEGSGTEKGREAAFTALELLADGYNEGFLRDDEASYLHITVVSDEDDDSDGSPVGKREFAAWLNQIRPYTHRTTWNSIVNLDEGGFAEERGEKYLWLTDEVGGVARDIDTADWDSILDELGGLQAPQPYEEFFLSQRPVPETIDVKVVHDGITFVYEQELDYVWSQARNSVRFLDPADTPAAGAEVLITYTIDGARFDGDEEGDELLIEK